MKKNIHNRVKVQILILFPREKWDGWVNKGMKRKKEDTTHDFGGVVQVAHASSSVPSVAEKSLGRKGGS